MLWYLIGPKTMTIDGFETINSVKYQAERANENNPLKRPAQKEKAQRQLNHS